MTTAHFLTLLPVAAALLAYCSARVLRLPFRMGTLHLITVLTLLGLVYAYEKAGSLLWLSASLRPLDFGELLLHGLLPLLLFVQAFSIDPEALAGNMLQSTTTAVCGTVFLSAGLATIAKLAFHLLHCAVPWNEAILLGTILSASDPGLGRELLAHMGHTGKRQTRLGADSLVGAALVSSVVSGFNAGSGSLAPGSAMFASASVSVLGALALGMLGAALACHFAVQSPSHSRYLLLLLAFGGYPVAEGLGLAAPLEAVVAGLFLRILFERRALMREAVRSSKLFCDIFDVILSSTVLVLLGCVGIVTNYNRSQFALGLVLAGCCLVIRTGIVILLEPAAREGRSGARVLGVYPVRALIPLALALSLALRLGRSWIVPVVYVAALGNVVLLGAAMKLLGTPRHPHPIRLGSLT